MPVELYPYWQAAQRAQGNQQILDENARQAGVAGALPQDLASLAVANPIAREISGGTPAQPAQPPTQTETPSGEPGVDQEGQPIEGNAPMTMQAKPGTPEVPATPPVIAKGQTMANLVQQIGPDRVARLMQTQEGRKALQNQGVLTEEEMNSRERVLTAREDFKKLRGEADQLMAQGDAAGTLMKLSRAWERLAEASEDPQKSAWAYTMAKDFQKQALEAKDNVLANDDFKAWSEASKAFHRHPTQDTFDALIEAGVDMKSKEGRGIRDRFLQNVNQDSLKVMTDPQLVAWNTAFAQALSTQTNGNKPLDPVGAAREVLKQSPDMLGPVLSVYERTGKQMPDYLRQAIFGLESKDFKNNQGDAFILTEAEGYHLNDPDPAKREAAVQQYLKNLKALQQATMVRTPADITFDHYRAQVISANLRAEEVNLQKLQGQLKGPGAVMMKPAQKAKIEDDIVESQNRIRASQEALDRIGYGVTSPKPGGPGAATTAPGTIQAQGRQGALAIQIRDKVLTMGIKDPAKRKAEFVRQLRAAGLDPNAPAAGFQNQSPGQ